MRGLAKVSQASSGLRPRKMLLERWFEGRWQQFCMAAEWSSDALPHCSHSDIISVDGYKTNGLATLFCSKSRFANKTYEESIRLREIHVRGKDAPRRPPGDPRRPLRDPREPQMQSCCRSSLRQKSRCRSSLRQTNHVVEVH